MKVPCVLIIKKTAYSPADAFMNRLVKKPCIGDKPTFFAMIPSEKETAKYPSPTGILSLIPFLSSIISLPFFCIIRTVLLFVNQIFIILP